MSQRQFLRIEGDAVHLVTERTERTVRLSELLAEAGRQAGVTTPILPTGCRMFHAAGERSVFVIEQAPAVRQLVWRGMDRSGENREHWKLAFPYVVFVVAFARGEAVDTGSCRIFYRNAPLNGDETVQRVNLCNVYRSGAICTGDVRVSGQGLAAKAESFVSNFWGSRFNTDLYSESFEPAARRLPQVATLEAWANATSENPLFPLGLQWLEGPRLSDVIGGAA